MVPLIRPLSRYLRCHTLQVESWGSRIPIDLADELYGEIRRDTTDIVQIARWTGCKPASIAKVKAHLFLEFHYLDSYESLGVPPTMARFDSDRHIAESWLRLKAGTFSSSDMQLLRHEAAEAWYMRKHGPSYRIAHAAAQERYPAPIQLWS
jgi:hypothetical protein